MQSSLQDRVLSANCADATSPPVAPIVATGDTPRDRFEIIVARSVDPDDAVLLLRGEFVGHREAAIRQARVVLRGAVVRHGHVGIGVQVIAGDGFPVYCQAWEALR